MNLTHPGVAERIAALQSGLGGDYLVGIRHQVHDERDPAWLGRDDVRRGLRAVAAAGLTYDLLVRPRELGAATDTARALPELRFVVDHIAKPRIADGRDDAWSAAMPALLSLENVTVKLSGLVTEANWGSWTTEDLRPFVLAVIGWAGIDKVMFGSDWPVCTLAASYADVFAALVDISGGVDPRVFGDNATTTYGLRS